jgi:uncharacterized protein (TIRG00374 family)
MTVAAAPRQGNFFQRLSPATKRWIALGTWLVATALVAAAFHAVGWGKTVHALRQASVPWLLAAALANLSILALWAWQSLVFLPDDRRVSFGRMFQVTALTTTATNTAPAFLGQAAGVGLMAERGGVGMAVALSVLAQHQMVEGITKVAMLFAAAHVAPLPPWMHRALVGLTVGVAALAAVLAAAAVSASRRPTDRPAGKLRTFVERWASGLVALRSPRRFALGLAIALLMKLAEAGGWFAVERAFHVAPRAGSPFLALAAVNIASAASASPGNLGVYEAAGFFVYTSLRVPHDVAFALAVAGHLCYLLPLAGCGWVLLSWEEIRAFGKRRAQSAERRASVD